MHLTLNVSLRTNFDRKVKSLREDVEENELIYFSEYCCGFLKLILSFNLFKIKMLLCNIVKINHIKFYYITEATKSNCTI